MKKIWRKGYFLLSLTALVLFLGVRVQAEEPETIKAGIYAGEIDLSGKNVTEAGEAIDRYVNGLKSVQVTLKINENHDVTVTAGDMGVSWANTDLPQIALEYGTRGNVIQRYKALRDLEYEMYAMDIALDFDRELINAILTEQCTKYDRKAVNARLKRSENNTLEVLNGIQGQVLDVEASGQKIYDYLTEEWDGRPCSIELEMMAEQPKGSTEELSELTDLLGSFTTSYSTSSSSRSANVENGCRLINGTTLYPGEEFSTYETVSPFSKANGYYMAGSYMNGKVVDSLGGGICQVSTTLYNAVLLSELEVTERHNHSMIVTYVDPSADAAIAESAGKDFKFVNNLDYPIYIEGYTENKEITFNIYGKETRDAGHSVKYESEILQVIRPSHDNIYADGGRGIGYIVTEGAHIGYKAKLWKVVMQDGQEVSREEVNSSSYKVSPRSATVGVATDDPNAYNEIMAAIGTGSIDHVRNVIAGLTAPAAAE